jgi:chemotaxis protein MotB
MLRTLTILVTLVLGACVSQGTYDDLKKKYDDAQTQLDERAKSIQALEAAVAEGQAQSAELARQIAALEEQKAANEKEIASLEGERSRLEGELANLIKDKSRLKEATDQLKLALKELSARKAEADRRVAEFRSLLAKFKELIDAGKLQVKIVDGRMVLALPTDVLFPSGSAKLSKEGIEAVTVVAVVLKDMKDRRFQVEGHTDNVPIKTAQYPSNWELAAARALGVLKAMVEAGMAPGGLSAASYGELHPVANNDTKEGRAQNRRIEIVLVPDLSMLPGFQELERVVKKQ